MEVISTGNCTKEHVSLANGTNEPRIDKSTSAAAAAVVRDKSLPSVRFSIESYPSGQHRIEPSKLDFLPAKLTTFTPNRTDKQNIQSQLQSELSQTLSRARLRQRLPDSFTGEVNNRTNQASNSIVACPVIVTSNSGPSRCDRNDCNDDNSKSLGQQKSQSNCQVTTTATVAIEKCEPASIFAGTNKSAVGVRLTKINNGSHSSTVVISEPPVPEEMAIDLERNVKNGKEKQVAIITDAGESKFSNWPGRKPAPEIQAKMAALTLLNKNQTANSNQPIITLNNRFSKGDADLTKAITQSADNKVTIQISTYTSRSTASSVLKPTASAKTKNISFGKT